MSSARIPACVRVRLKPNSVARVREWAKYIQEHKAEALQTLRAEGVSIETVFLESTAEGDFLVYYMRATSLDQAKLVAAQSMAAIDQYHKAFKRESWAEVVKLELLLDLEQDAA